MSAVSAIPVLGRASCTTAAGPKTEGWDLDAGDIQTVSHITDTTELRDFTRDRT